MKTLIRLLAALFCTSAFAANTTAYNAAAIAVNPAGQLSFLNVNSMGQVLLSGFGTINTTAQGGVGVAVSPSGTLSFLNVDSQGGLLISGSSFTAPMLIGGAQQYTDAAQFTLGQLTATSAQMSGLTSAVLGIQSLGTGASQSVDFIAFADNTNGTSTHFVDMGINSSGNNSGSYPTGANIAFSESASDDYYVGTVGNNAVHLFTNSADILDISGLGVVSEAGSATGGTYASFMPVWVEVKSVTILTATTPANLATIVIPKGITRYFVEAAGAIQCYAETASGTLAGGTIQLRTATSGGGSQIGSTITPPAAATSMTTTAGSSTTPLTNTTIYLYQTGNSANAGTVTVSIRLSPF